MTGNSATLTILAILTTTGTQCDCTNQSQHTTNAVNNSRTSKVVEHVAKSCHHEAVGSIVAKPTATPGPVTLDGINQQRNDSAINNVHRDNCTVNQIHRELGTLGHSTTNDGSSCSTEDSLENQEALNRQVTLVEREVTPVGQTDKASQRIASEHKAEAHEPEQQRAEHKINKVLEQDVSRILTAREACLTQRETRLHKEHQHGSQQHPNSI